MKKLALFGAGRTGHYVAELVPVAGADGQFLRLAVFPPERSLSESLSGWRGQKEKLLAALRAGK